MINRFIIVGTQRTGSSAFAISLSKHPDIFTGWEWMLDIPIWEKLAIAQQGLALNFENLVEADRKHVAAEYHGQPLVGFRWLFRSSAKWLLHPRFSPALFIDRLELFIDWARREDNLKVLHIVRNNNMAWLQSKEMSLSSGLYIDKAYPKDLKVEINVKEALKRLQTKNWVDSRLASLEGTGRYMRVRFEEFAQDNDQVTRKALGFLGCQLEGLPSFDASIRRQSRSKGSGDTITNSEALRAVLAERNLLFSEF